MKASAASVIAPRLCLLSRSNSYILVVVHYSTAYFPIGVLAPLTCVPKGHKSMPATRMYANKSKNNILSCASGAQSKH